MFDALWSSPVGTYNPLEGKDFATACLLCPPNSVTLQTSSTQRSDCVCMDGFYDINVSYAVDPELLRISTNECEEYANKCPPVEMNAAVIECKVCPFGTDCEQGSTLEALPLLRGFYRVGEQSIDVREVSAGIRNPASRAAASANGRLILHSAPTRPPIARPGSLARTIA